MNKNNFTYQSDHSNKRVKRVSARSANEFLSRRIAELGTGDHTMIDDIFDLPRPDYLSFNELNESEWVPNFDQEQDYDDELYLSCDENESNHNENPDFEKEDKDIFNNGKYIRYVHQPKTDSKC